MNMYCLHKMCTRTHRRYERRNWHDRARTGWEWRNFLVKAYKFSGSMQLDVDEIRINFILTIMQAIQKINIKARFVFDAIMQNEGAWLCFKPGYQSQLLVCAVHISPRSPG